jgi:transcriptional regulator with XRE-family HTH domain
MPVAGLKIRDYSQLRSALANRRMQLGLRQLDVDEASSLQTGYVSKLEAGIRHLGPLSLPMLLAALDADLVLVPRSATVAPVERTGSAGLVHHLPRTGDTPS